MAATTPMTVYGFSNVDISKQIIVADGVFAGISRANQTISIYHGETLIADCTMPATGIERIPTVVLGELTLHDETFTGFVEGETYTIVAGDEPPITGLVMNGGLFSFDPSALWAILSGDGSIISADYSNTRTNYTISQKITTTKKRYDIKRLPEELLPKTVATKAEVRKVRSTAEKAQTTAEKAQTTAEAAQSTAEAAQSTAEAAQSTAESAMNKISLNPKNFLGSLYSRNNEIVGWYKNLPLLLYSSDTGEFFKNAWETTGIEISNLTGEFMCNFDDKMAICRCLVVGGANKYCIKGVAFGWFGDTAPIYCVSSDIFAGDTDAGIYLALSPYSYFLLSSSTSNSTKQFKITVDDSGAISATEVV